MNELEDLFLKKYGVVRGAQTRLAKDLGTNQSTIASWINGRTKPSADFIRKMALIFNLSESEIKRTFGIILNPNQNYLLRDSSINYPIEIDEPKTDFPLRAFFKKGEVFFLNEADIPLPNTLGRTKRFSLEIRDESAHPDFKKGEVLGILAMTAEEANQYTGDQYILADLKGSQYLYHCFVSGTKHCVSISNRHKEMPTEAVIIGRVMFRTEFI